MARPKGEAGPDPAAEIAGRERARDALFKIEEHIRAAYKLTAGHGYEGWAELCGALREAHDGPLVDAVGSNASRLGELRKARGGLRCECGKLAPRNAQGGARWTCPACRKGVLA